jgi:hypothetical protein
MENSLISPVLPVTGNLVWYNHKDVHDDYPGIPPGTDEEKIIVSSPARAQRPRRE